MNISGHAYLRMAERGFTAEMLKAFMDGSYGVFLTAKTQQRHHVSSYLAELNKKKLE